MAASGELHDGFWEFRDAKIVTPGVETLPASTYLLATTLDRREVAQAFVAPETVSFWSLPELGRADGASGPRSDRVRFQISGASRPTVNAGGHGVGCRLLFVKILPNGRGRVYGFRWRRRRLRALCGDESDQRSRRGWLHQRNRCGMVAWTCRVSVWRLRVAAARGWLMGFTVSSSLEPPVAPGRGRRARACWRLRSRGSRRPS